MCPQPPRAVWQQNASELFRSLPDCSCGPLKKGPAIQQWQRVRLEGAGQGLILTRVIHLQATFTMKNLEQQKRHKWQYAILPLPAGMVANIRPACCGCLEPACDLSLPLPAVPSPPSGHNVCAPNGHQVTNNTHQGGPYVIVCGKVPQQCVPQSVLLSATLAQRQAVYSHPSNKTHSLTCAPSHARSLQLITTPQKTTKT